MAKQTIEWEEEATRMLQQTGGSPVVRSRVRERLEDAALGHGQSRVTAAMAGELLEVQARWGWGGVFAEYERTDPSATYRGFFGAKDADEAARQLRAATGKTDASVEPIVDFYVEVLGLQPGAKVLDLGCGWGRVAIPLAKRGFAVTGIDHGEDGLAIARASAQQEGAEVGFLCADLLVLPWEGLADEAEFDAVLSAGVLFQAFPESEEEAQKLLLEVSRLLKPGGHCFIGDFPNRDAVLRTARMERGGTAVQHFWSEEGPTFSLVERRFRLAEGRLYTRRVTISPNRAPQESREVVHVYTLAELCELLGNAGLAFQSSWSGTWGAPYVDYTLEREEMAILAQKEG